MDWKKTGSIIPKATSTTIGGVKVGDNIAVTNDGTISTDVNKAYVDKLISEIPKTAIYFIQRNPLDFTINGNSYNGISSSMGVISDNNNNIMSGYIEIEGVSGNYSAGDSITIGISGFHFFGPYTTFTTDSAYITGLYYNSSDGGNTLIGSITKDTTNIPDFSIFVNTLSNRFIAKDGLAGFVKPSTSITAASDGTIKVNPAIFSDGLTATDAQVSVDFDYINNHYGITSSLDVDGLNMLVTKSGTLIPPFAAMYGVTGVVGFLNEDSYMKPGTSGMLAEWCVDVDKIGKHLAGDALYYDSASGLMLKCGTGLHIDNDAVSVDTDTLPLATASTRGTVKVGSGLSIAKDGTLSATGAAASADGVRYVGMVGGTESTGLISTLANVLANYDDTRVWYDVITATFAFNTTVAFTAGTTATFTMGSGYSFDVTGDDTFWECVTDNASVKATLTNATTLTLSFKSDVAANTTFHVKVR